MSTSQPITPRYFRAKQGNEGVIVFVHGLFGDGTSSWMYSEPKSDTRAYWPDLLKHDSTFDKQDIYVFEYSTGLSSSFSIDELAENMRLVLTADHVFKHKKVFFLTHSMGGLVTRAFLLKYRDLAKQVAFIYFFATPTTGAAVAR